MRITNDIRESICNAAVRKTLEKRDAFLAKESDELAVLVYDRLYLPTEQEMMNKLPAEYFHQKSEIYVKQPGMKYDSDKITLTLKSSRKISARDYEYRRPSWDIKTGEENAVTIRIDKLVAGRIKFNKDKDLLTAKITAMLSGINTVKRLQEEWPEGSEFYKNLTPSKPTINLPSVRGADISKLILDLGTD